MKLTKFFSMILTFVFIACVIVSCAKSSELSTNNVAPTSTWTNNLILTYNGNNYKVTKDTTNDVDQMIGTISYHGNGTVFKLYSIKGISDNSKIAVQSGQSYLIAVLDKKD